MSDAGQEDSCPFEAQKGLYHKQFLRVVYGSVMLGAMDGIMHNIKKSASLILPMYQNLPITLFKSTEVWGPPTIY